MYMSAHPSPPQIPIKGQLHPATDLYYNQNSMESVHTSMIFWII